MESLKQNQTVRDVWTRVPPRAHMCEDDHHLYLRTAEAELTTVSFRGRMRKLYFLKNLGGYSHSFSFSLHFLSLCLSVYLLVFLLVRFNFRFKMRQSKMLLFLEKSLAQSLINKFGYDAADGGRSLKMRHGRTDGLTYTPSYRDAIPHLKRSV